MVDKNIDIFNLDNLHEDCNLSREEIEKEILIPHSNSIGNKILSLFSIKNPLTINEIIIGIAVKYKMKIPRRNILSRLFYLVEKGKLKKIIKKDSLNDKKILTYEKEKVLSLEERFPPGTLHIINTKHY